MRRSSFTTAPLVAGILILGLLCMATNSRAAQLFTAPEATGTAPPCSPDARCRLDFAITAAGIGDEVLAAPGEYFESGSTPWDALPPLETSRTLRGEDPAEPPVIHGETVLNATPFLRLASGATVSDVEFRTTAIDTFGSGYAYGVTLDSGAILNRSRVDTEGVPGVTMTACLPFGATIRNSVCRGYGPGDVDAIQSAVTGPSLTSHVINSTAITTTPTGFGIKVGMSGAFTNLINVSNSIARGPSADLSTGTRVNAPIGTAVLNVEYSNWNTYTATGMGSNFLIPDAGNQNGPTAATPLFFDGAIGDYREAAGSPTIDAGLASANADPITLGGTVRKSGTAVDIGAYEHVPAPDVESKPASAISDTTVTLNGDVTPNGSPTATRFEYGKSIPYDRSAPGPGIPADAPATGVEAEITGLDPNTTYHYRAVAESNGGGESRGADLTFTTARNSVKPQPALALTGLKVRKRWRISRGGLVRFRLSLPARVELTFSRGRKGSFRRRGTKTLRADKGVNRVRIKRRLNRGRRLVPGRYRLRATATRADGSRDTAGPVRFRIRR